MGASAVRAGAVAAQCSVLPRRRRAQRSRQCFPNATSAGVLRRLVAHVQCGVGVDAREPLPGRIRCGLRCARQGCSQHTRFARVLARLAAAATAALQYTRVRRCSCAAAAAAVAAGCTTGGRGWRRGLLRARCGCHEQCDGGGRLLRGLSCHWRSFGLHRRMPSVLQCLERLSHQLRHQLRGAQLRDAAELRHRAQRRLGLLPLAEPCVQRICSAVLRLGV